MRGDDWCASTASLLLSFVRYIRLKTLAPPQLTYLTVLVMRGAAVSNLALLGLCEKSPQLHTLSVKACSRITRMFFDALGARAPKLRHLNLVRVNDFDYIKYDKLATSLTTLETLKMCDESKLRECS